MEYTVFQNMFPSFSDYECLLSFISVGPYALVSACLHLLTGEPETIQRPFSRTCGLFSAVTQSALHLPSPLTCLLHPSCVSPSLSLLFTAFSLVPETTLASLGYSPPPLSFLFFCFPCPVLIVHFSSKEDSEQLPPGRIWFAGIFHFMDRLFMKHFQFTINV